MTNSRRKSDIAGLIVALAAGSCYAYRQNAAQSPEQRYKLQETERGDIKQKV